jgi:D-apionolactonase
MTVLNPGHMRTGAARVDTRDDVLIQAGEVSARIRGPEVWQVRLRDWLVVERLYVAVRDTEWNTVPCQLKGYELASSRTGELAVITAVHQVGPASSFTWTGRLELTAPASLTFSFQGQAVGTFMAAKIGVCIHHPVSSVAGRRYRAGHPTSTSSGTLPQLVGPGGTLRALFDEFDGLTIAGPGERQVAFAMSGELFEMQDHRNWTDNNFKSYAVPNWKPTPVTYGPGQVVRQSVVLRLAGQRPVRPRRVTASQRTRPVTVRIAARPGSDRLPALGSCLPRELRLADADKRRLRDAKLSHVSIGLDLTQSGWGEDLQRGAAVAAAAGAELEVTASVIPRHADDLVEFARSTSHLAAPVSAIVLVAADGQLPALPDLVATARRAAGPGSASERVGAGTSTFFADINSHREHFAGMAVLGFPLSPQVHACDDKSVMHNIGGQAVVLRTIASFAPKARVHVGPISLIPASGPYAAGRNARAGLADSVDPRQGSLFAAAWTVGSLAELIEGGAASATYFDLAGQRGLMAAADSAQAPCPGIPLPAEAVFPVFHVLSFASAAGSRQCLPLTSSAPEVVRGLAIRSRSGIRALLCNLTADPVEVHLTAPAFRLAGTALDEFSYLRASQSSSWAGDSPVAELPEREGIARIMLRPFAVQLLHGQTR